MFLIITISISFLAFSLFKSLQSRLLLVLIISYQFILALAMDLNQKLDIFSDCDRFENRLLLFLYASEFILFLCVGSVISVSPKVTRHLNTAGQYGVDHIVTFLLLVLILWEVQLSDFAGVSGAYSSDLKPTYFFEYLNIVFGFVFYLVGTTRKLIALLLFHVTLSILNGERMIAITALFTFGFSCRPLAFKRIHLLYSFFFVVGLILVDDFRSGERVSASLMDRFVFDDKVTHHGSLLYSSLVLIDFSDSGLSLTAFGDAFAFLLGLDGSTKNSGFAEILSSFSKRGGGGMAPSYFAALFGKSLAPFLTLIIGVLVGRFMRRFEQNQSSPVSVVYLGFLPHAWGYSPVHFFKGPIITLAIFILYLIWTKISNKLRR